MADIEFAGQRFAVAESMGLMPLMRLAKLASGGADADEMASLAALYDVLEQCIAASDWQSFQDAATRSRADGEALQRAIGAAMHVMQERPTSRSSDSSGGPSSTRPSSAGDSSSQVMSRLEQQGRPDLALIVMQAQESRSA